MSPLYPDDNTPVPDLLTPLEACRYLRILEQKKGHEERSLKALEYLTYTKRAIQPIIVSNRRLYALTELQRYLKDGEGSSSWANRR